MFNIIIRRAVVVTAGAGIALTLMAAPASAAPKADGGRQGATTETQTEEKNSTATVTVTVSCDNVVTVTSDKDISHVEWKLADGTVDKQEGLRGYTWTRTFDQDVVSAKAKSGETIVFGYPENCDETESTPDASNDDVVKDDDVGNTDVKDDDKAPANNGGDNEDDSDEVEVDDETLVNEPATPTGTEEPSIAPEAFKCGEVMATDVNGDGRINAQDCTVVLGEVFERAPAAAPAALPAIAAEAVAATPAGAQVLGVQFDRAAPAALARTGATFAPLLLGAIVLIASGLLMVHGRRRDSNA